MITDDLQMYACLQYRVNWRPHLTSGWTLIAEHSTYGEAKTEAENCLKRWGGNTRVIYQRTIYARSHFGVKGQ